MDLRSLILVLSSALLAVSSFVYGWKFVKRRNYLLGVELWIVGISSTNAIGFFSTGSEALYEISHFFDAFSRGFGMPIISVAGLMAVTHGYKPSIRQDIGVFLASFAGAFVLVGTSFMSGALPYYYLLMWTLMSLYLVYFIKRLLGVGATRQAMALLLALVTSQAIACINDFYKIPGEETNVVFNFYTLALCTWAYFEVAIYFAYRALERAQNGRTAFGETVPYSS